MSNTVPFTSVASDFLKLVNIPDDKKPELIDYTATDFLELRNALIEYVKAVYPLDYKNFAESDLGVMLLELVAYMGSVLSLKADMLVHENFIRTAKDRDSVRKLFELVGVSMKGPTSAQANVDLIVPETTGTLVIEPEGRVVTVTSPEDGESVSYTLYDIRNGTLSEVLNSNANITLELSAFPSEGGNATVSIGLLEGVFAVASGQLGETAALKNIVLEEGPIVQNSAQVLVGSEVYRQVENLYSASSTDDRVFQMVYDDDYKGTILFGDGTNGKSPDTNADYVVTYRVGGGTRGNLPDSYINTTTNVKVGVASLTASVIQQGLATGGADAETVEHAKRYAPLTYRRQDRLVSLEDYAAFVARFTSPTGTTGKGTAVTRKAYSSANVIDLYVLEKATSQQLQKASLTFKSELLSNISPLKMITDEVVVVDGLIRTVDLVTTIFVDERYRGVEGTIKSKVARAVEQYFLADNWDFKDPLILSELNRTIQGIDEVRFSSIDNLDNDITVEFNEIIQLNNLTINVSFV